MITKTLETSFMTVELELNDEGEVEGAAMSSTLEHGNDDLSRAFDGIESLVLAHACAGINITSPAYREGIETAVETCTNNLE